jgi:DNA-directed RNA polymerase subunit RPC12/RpoP
MAKIPCLLCSQELGQRKDKNNKPYFICDPCGMQIFVRGRQGIENLAQLIATLRKHDFPFREHARVLYEVQAILTEIRGIKKEIKKLDSVLKLFSNDEHKERTRELLNTRIENLLLRLEQIANSNIHS